MRLTGTEDVDIKIDANGQPLPDNNGDCILCSGKECWMQDIWIEMLTEEGELLWEDQEGIQAYGFGLTEYLNAELDEDLKEEFSAGIISKLTKRDYIDEGSININMTITSLNTWQTHIQFKENDGTDFLIDVGTDGKEIYVT